MSAELIAVRLGTALMGRAAQLVLAKQQNDQAIRYDMTDLVRRHIPGVRAKRSVTRQFEQIADTVAARLEPMLAQEFRGIDSGEHAAVVDAVVDTFEHTDLSDAAIFASNADPAQLARQIRAASSPPAGLSAAGDALYHQLVAECCDCYVQIVRHLPVFTERAVSELLRRGDELSKDIGLVLERLPKRSLYAPDGEGDDAAFRREYLELVSRVLDEVELFSFAVEEPVRTKLSVAYVSLRVTRDSIGRRRARRSTDAVRSGTDSATWRSEERETGGERVEKALSLRPRILLRGEAGSGKTTLLRWLAVTAARSAFTDDLTSWNGLVPVLLRLRSYASRTLPGLDELLDDTAGPLTSHMPNAWLDRLFADGQVLLLIDGVDELLPADRDRVREWITRLLHAYPRTRIVVTSRPAAAHQEWLAGRDFAHVELERMTPADLNAFVRQWHQAVGESGQRLPCAAAELPAYERALTASIKDRAHLSALASSPLLAAMLCSLHLGRNRQLPRNRMELYRIAVELLVQRRDAERHIPSAQSVRLSLTDKLSLLRDLAWRLSDNNRSELDAETAHGYVRARLASMRHLDVEAQPVLDYLVNRSGILRSPSVGRIDFVHRTFQEYLASAEAAAEDRIGNLIGRAHLDVWRDTIIMTAGHANRSQRHELLSGILDLAAAEPAQRHHLGLLATSCLETIESISDDLADRLDRTIAELIPPHTPAEAVALAAVGEPALRHLPRGIQDLPPEHAAATVRTAAFIGGPAALRLLNGYAGDERWMVLQELRNAWQYSDPTKYAEQVLAHGTSTLRRMLRLTHPAQWQAAVRLDDLRDLVLDYPVNLGGIAFEELPAVATLTVRQLTGTNDLSVLTAAQFPSAGLRLRLRPSNGQAALDHLEALSALSGLASLSLTGWARLPALSPGALPLGLRSLRLGDVAADYDLTPVADHDLAVLELRGRNAAAALARVGRASRVHRLSLVGCDLTRSFHRLPPVLPLLETLELRSSTLPYDLVSLTDFPELTEVRLVDCVGPERSVVNIASIPQPRAPRQLDIGIDEATRTTAPTASRDRIVYRELPSPVTDHESSDPNAT